MSDSDNFGQPPLEGGLDSRLDVALRVAYGSPATDAAFPHGSVLTAIQDSTGVSSHILLRDELESSPAIVSPCSDVDSAGGHGRYQVLGEIARGGMGIILKGRDPDLGRDVAMKVLHPSNVHNPVMIQRFIEEAQIGGQLQHPGILPIYELGVDSGQRPYFTMRLVKGRTLAAMLEERSDPARDLSHFLAIFEHVCQTMAYAHARGVIHRDLKPSNVMVGAFGEVQVVDWGLSKVLQQRESVEGLRISLAAPEPQVKTVRSTSGSSPSQAGAVIGTPSYMSPEQARGELESLDEQTDVFALGAILCEILTGQPPYLGSRSEILDHAAEGRLKGTWSRLESCSAERELIQLAMRCLSPLRSGRPRNGGILARDFTAFLESVGERARLAELAAATARATAEIKRRTGRRTTLLALVLGLALTVGVLFALKAERERRLRAEHSIADVAALYRKANWFRDQAQRVPPDQLEIWEQALAQVRRTAEIVGSGAIDDDSRQTVERIVTDLRHEEEKVHEQALRYRLKQAQ